MHDLVNFDLMPMDTILYKYNSLVISYQMGKVELTDDLNIFEKNISPVDPPGI